MNKDCKQCGVGFEVTDEDLKFYDRISPKFGDKKFSIPAPTFCPDCRMQRRFASRNERNLYHRKCDLTGKMIISNYSPTSCMTVYDVDSWWGDNWDALDYGAEYDFDRSFFSQFDELQKKVPVLGLHVVNNQNSPYVNYTAECKNCHMVFGPVYSEDCMYGSPYYSKNCFDTLLVRDCELCYECVTCDGCYECLYCQDCTNSRNLIYCYDCVACKDCIGCSGLRNKSFYVFNEKYSKEEYLKFRSNFDLCDDDQVQQILDKFSEIKLDTPKRAMVSVNVQNCIGDYIYESKNSTDCYDVKRCEDVSFLAQTIDMKDCYDSNYTEENELCYEYLGYYRNNKCLFSNGCHNTYDLLYCAYCASCKNCLGCISLQHKQYCILNKQYTKEEYEKLVPQIIKSMDEKREWGEFFPAEISPFAYNETVAYEYFPMSRDAVEKNGWQWKEDESEKMYKGPELDIPKDISMVDDSICKGILRCDVSSKLFKVTPQELGFYRRMKLPIPRECPDERHKKRLALRNPRHLWDRNCDKCGANIKTSYAPDRKETVFCEKCYLEAVY